MSRLPIKKGTEVKAKTRPPTKAQREAAAAEKRQANSQATLARRQRYMFIARQAEQVVSEYQKSGFDRMISPFEDLQTALDELAAYFNHNEEAE